MHVTTFIPFVQACVRAHVWFARDCPGYSSIYFVIYFRFLDAIFGYVSIHFDSEYRIRPMFQSLSMTVVDLQWLWISIASLYWSSLLAHDGAHCPPLWRSLHPFWPCESLSLVVLLSWSASRFSYACLVFKLYSFPESIRCQFETVCVRTIEVGPTGVLGGQLTGVSRAAGQCKVLWSQAYAGYTRIQTYY